MNYPDANKRALATLHDYAANWQCVPSAQIAGQQAVKMEAAAGEETGRYVIDL